MLCQALLKNISKDTSPTDFESSQDKILTSGLDEQMWISNSAIREVRFIIIAQTEVSNNSCDAKENCCYNPKNKQLTLLPTGMYNWNVKFEFANFLRQDKNEL